MWIIILTIATVMFLIGCGIGYVSCISLIYYMKKKGYKLPDDNEIKECIHYVVKHLFK